jgi:hypothetical protein
MKKNSKDYEYFNKIKNQSFTPIFILGLHRSGTSILYKTLGDTKRFNILNAYHIFYYDSLLYNYINKIEETKKEELNSLFKSKGITTRKTDNMLVTSDYAYEYMFIFLKQKYPFKISKKNKLLFDEICNKLKFISNNNYPILLKNPHDFSNFIYIKNIYPNAKFIFIHRNPLDVINSTMRLLKSIYKSKNEYIAIFSKNYDKIYDNKLALMLCRLYCCSYLPLGVFEVIYSNSKKLDYYLKNINKLSKDDYISIKYEDFCKGPYNEISKIMKFLNIEYELDNKNPITERNLDLVTEVDFLKEYIYKKMQKYFQYFDYRIK